MRLAIGFKGLLKELPQASLKTLSRRISARRLCCAAELRTELNIA